jgi:hypothetical protein
MMDDQPHITAAGTLRATCLPPPFRHFATPATPRRRRQAVTFRHFISYFHDPTRFRLHALLRRTEHGKYATQEQKTGLPTNTSIHSPVTTFPPSDTNR